MKSLLSNLVSVKGSRKKKKLLGRGPGSGHGKTSTRGHKGQRARAGRDFYLGFEGGQSPLIRRIPKRGFTHIKKHPYQLVNLNDLNDFPKGFLVDAKALREKGLINDNRGLIKILADGDLTVALSVQANKFSRNAIKKIEKSGGKTELVK